MSNTTTSAASTSSGSPKRYRVLVGLDYPPLKRAEPGDVVDDLPASSVKWLLADGLIKPAKKGS